MPSRVPLHVDAENDLVGEKVPKQTVAVPAAFQRSDVYTKFIGSTFSSPFQDKMRPFIGNGLKKEKTISIGTVHVKNAGNYSEIITNRYKPQDGRIGEFNAPQRNNGKILQMTGEPLSAVAPTRIDISKVNTPSSSFGTKYGNNAGIHGMKVSGVKTTTTAVNPMANNIAPSPQFKEASSNEVDDVVVTDIVEIKKPTMFNQEWQGSGTKQQVNKPKAKHDDQNHSPLVLQNTKVTDTLNGNRARNNSLPAKLEQRLPKFADGHEGHILYQAVKGQSSFVNKGSWKTSSGILYKLLESIHNSKTSADSQNAKIHAKSHVQEERAGDQLENMRSDQVNHEYKTATQHGRKGPATLAKQNLNGKHVGQGNYHKGNSPWVTGKNQAGRDDFKKESGGQEVLGGYGVQDIGNHFQPNNGTFGSKFLGGSNSKWVKQIGHHKEGLRMNHRGNEMNDVQGNKGLLKESYGGFHDKFIFAPEQNGAPQQEQIDSNNPTQNPDEDEVEYDMGGKLTEPALDQRYVPVDEFGSPIYGNETGQLRI